MIRFPEIWKKYEQGELKKLAPIKNEKTQETGFNDIDASGQAITTITSFNDKPVGKKILQEAKKTRPAFTNLEDILKTIEPVEASMQQLADNIHLHGHFIRAMRIGDFYDNLLIQFEESTYKLFNKHLVNLKEGYVIKYLKQERAKTDKYHEDMIKLYKLIDKRELQNEIPVPNKESVKTYSNLQAKVNDVKKAIHKLNDEYVALSFKKNEKKSIRQLRKQIKNFWGNGLLADANKIPFKEGAEELAALYSDFTIAINNPAQAKQKQKYLLKQQTKKKTKHTVTNNEELTGSLPAQKYEDTTKTKQEITTLSDEPYSFSMHVMKYNYPKNFQYMPLHSSLTERESWEKRFENFNRQLNNLIVADNKIPTSPEDKQYIKVLAEGLYLAIESPEKDFPIATAKRTYETLQDILT